MPELKTTVPEDTLPVVEAFIHRWERSGAAERANYQLFLSELCDILQVARPDPAGADDSRNAYVFERVVAFQHGDGNSSAGRMDLYKRGCFVLEAKQGANVPEPEQPLSAAARELKRKLKTGTARRGTAAWDDAMLRARGQAEQYGRALPPAEGRPPFLIVVDVGHSIELYSEFSCTGGTYIPFPAPGSHRIFLRDLERPDIRERLRLVWTAPHELDPTRRSARVTREIAASLAKLAVSLEKDNHDPHVVASFLMRALFTMFAEDVGLLARNSFSNLLLSLRDKPQDFVPVVEELWGKMDRGGYSISLRLPVLQFNGGLFESATALPLNQDQLLLLIEAAQCDWRDVEPAIFGTLLERALAPEERHKLGAHYPQGLRRAFGHAHHRGADPRRVGDRPHRGGGTGQQRRATQGGQGVEGLSPETVPHPRARSRLRQRQLPLCHAGTPQTDRGRSPGYPQPHGRAAGGAGYGGRDGRAAPVPRTGDQPPRGGDCRAGALDRHPAMALPQPGQCPSAPADHPQLPQYPVQGCPD